MYLFFDVETTGLFTARHDRIVEIAAVRVGETGEIEHEFVSLVNPQRDIGPTSVHGLVSSDILEAPTFAELAGEIAEFFDGATVYGAHNAYFDHDFLRAEFSRCEVEIPDIPLLCTMRSAGGGCLQTCCQNYGVSPPAEAHSALDDARAAALLFVELHKHNRVKTEFRWTRWPEIAKSGRQPVTRKEIRSRPKTNHYLDRLAELSRDYNPAQVSDAASWAYLALLDRVLEDRRIDTCEGNALIETASRWGLTLPQVESLHSEYLRRLGSIALMDGIVTKAERRDIHQVATLLGRSTQDVDVVLNAAVTQMASIGHVPTPVVETSEPAALGLCGQTVCFTGELVGSIHGKPLQRKDAQNLATQAGLIVKNGVTKDLDILVVADPDTQSSKAKKARQYQTRIMAEHVFWQTLGIKVD